MCDLYILSRTKQIFEKIQKVKVVIKEKEKGKKEKEKEKRKIKEKKKFHVIKDD